MNIKEIKMPFIKVANIVKNDNNNIKRKLSCEWCVDKDIQQKEDGRIYLFTSNGEIKKIGGSTSKGGIKSTLGFYISANIGKPSISRFGVMYKIIEEINKGNIIEVYVSFIKSIRAKITGLLTESESIVKMSFIETEDICKSDYYSINNRYPEWNCQENGEKWGSDIEKSYMRYRKRSGI